MGACASALRRSSGNSSMKLRASLVHSDSIVNNKPENVFVHQPINGFTSRVSPFNSASSFSNHGSKEEKFFDSQTWIESDDEFYSVNGDLTPSRRSTPLYRSIPGTPDSRSLSFQVNTLPEEHNRSPLNRSVSEAALRVDTDGVATTKSPPPEKKRRKKLAELFRESFRRSRHQDEANNADANISGKTEEDKEKEKLAQWCFPRLHSARGFKKTMLPAPPIAVDS